MRCLRQFVCAVGFGVFACGGLAPAWAQDEARASARVAAQAGLKAFSEGHYSQAADLLERAESVYHAPTHLLYIARTYEKLGKLVKARETYWKLVQEQLAPDASKAFVSAKTDGGKELAALEPRLAYVTIQLHGPQAQNVRITVDGAPIPTALAGIPRPTDPGSHAYQAFADGMQSAQVNLLSKEASRETVTLALERVAGAATPASEGRNALPPATTVSSASPSTTATTSPFTNDNGPQPSEGSSGLRTAGFVSLGIGVVGLGVGAYFLASGLGKERDADNLYASCVAEHCSNQQDEINQLDNDAASQKTIGGVAIAAGGVGVIAGITMLVMGSSRSTAGITPWFGVSSAGVKGTF